MTRHRALQFLAFLALTIPALPPALFPFFQPYTFGKTTLFEIIVEAMALVWLSTRLFRAWTIFTRPYLVKIALLTFAVAATLSTLFADNPVTSFWGSSARMDGLFTLFHFVIFFFMLAASFAENAWRRLMQVSVGAGTFAALYGIAQWFGAPFVVASGGEIFGTLGNPSYLALYLLFTVFLAHHLAQQESKRETAILLYCAAAIQVIALLLTQVQAATLALAAGALVAAYPHIRARITLTRSAVALISIGALIFLFSFSANFAKLASLSEGGASLYNRIAVWRIALSGIAEKPLFGHGANNFESYYLAQKNMGGVPLPATGETFDKPHNAYLELAFSYGIVGLAAYLFFVGMIIRRARAFPALWGALMSYLAFLFFFFDTFASLLVFFFVAAFLFSSSPEENSDSAVQKTVSPFTLVAGGIALAAIFFTFHFRPLYSAYFARQFLMQTATTQTSNETLKAKALRHHAFNAPFIERAILLAERVIKK
ncbi:O-antigen ligase family protein [Candidatus Azambacteria bacterium]|nr:O-antigen ligase family protein [Candidatus Azambacteria bacterium]